MSPKLKREIARAVLVRQAARAGMPVGSFASRQARQEAEAYPRGRVGRPLRRRW